MRAETPLTASCRLPPHRLQPARATKPSRAGRQDQLRSLESNDDDAIPAVLSRSNNAPMRVTWRRDQGEDISHACATATQLAERVRRERHLLTHCRRRSLAPRAAELPRLQIGSSTDLRSPHWLDATRRTVRSIHGAIRRGGSCRHGRLDGHRLRTPHAL